MRRSVLLLVAALVLAGPLPVRAQGLDLGGDGPVDITADQGIEWRRDEQIVVARGNAKATRAGVTVRAERLIARYRNRAGAAAETSTTGVGGGEIYRLEAEGAVVITSATDRAEGERAVYDIDQAVLVLSGGSPRYQAGADSVTASQALEYWRDKRLAVARGDAQVQADGRRLSAGTITALLTDTSAPRPPSAGKPAPGEGRIVRVEAFDAVEIKTDTETVRGDRALYVPATGIAQLVGNVRILRGTNQLSGGVAEVNLKTGVSRLLPTRDGRVAGQIVPARPPATPPAAAPGAPRP